MIGHAHLALDKSENNKTFFRIEVSQYAAITKPSIVRLMELMLDLYIQGHIKLIHPTTVFDATEFEDAFRYKQQGTHVGKIIVKCSQHIENMPWTLALAELRLRNNGCYPLVGGMGGFGKAVALWMADYGVKNLIFLSRSTSKGNDVTFIDELEMLGCKV